MSGKQARAKYTQEYKLDAVRQVKAGQSIAVTAKVLGIPKASLGAWMRQSERGKLGSVTTSKPVAVTPEQMELARLRAENARLRMERDIGRKSRRTLRRMCCKVCLDSPNKSALASESLVRGAERERQRVFRLAPTAVNWPRLRWTTER